MADNLAKEVGNGKKGVQNKHHQKQEKDMNIRIQDWRTDLPLT
jgi:hypothetical protein